MKPLCYQAKNNIAKEKKDMGDYSRITITKKLSLEFFDREERNNKNIFF